MMHKQFVKILSLFFIFVLCASVFTCSAFAAASSESEEPMMEVESLEDAGISRETAMEVLGLTPQEAENMNFYALKSPRQLSFQSGDTYAFPKFTFTDDNIGSYFTVNANKLIYGVIWEVPSNQPAATIDVELYPYGQPRAYNIHLTTNLDAEGNQRITGKSDWINTYYGVDYHFIYKADAWEWDDRPVTSSVTMVIGVV